MANYYIRQDATSGDGSENSPYGSFTEFLAAESPSSGDSVFISNLKPLLEGEVTMTDLTGVTFDVWDERNDGSRWQKWNAESATPATLHATGAGFRVYKTATAVNANALGATEEWSKSKDSNGNRYGFLEEQANTTALETNRGHFIDGSNILFVSVPLSTDTTGKEYLVLIPGHGIIMTGCTNCTMKNGVVGLTTENGNGNGYGIRITGSSKNNTFIDMEFDGCQYHGFGDISNSPTHTLTRPIFRTHIRGTDSQYVAFGNNGIIENCVVDGAHFWPAPWMYVDQTSVDDWQSSSLTAGIKAIAAHHADDTDCSTAVQGIVIKNSIQHPNTYLPEVRSEYATFSANATNHPVPSDLDDWETYPVVFRDSEASGEIQVGGGSKGSTNSVNHVNIAIVRSTFDIDGSDASRPNTAYGGFIATSCQSVDADITSNILCVSSLLAAKTNSTADTRVIFNRLNGATMTLINCTLYLKGSYSDRQAIWSGASSMGQLKIIDSIFVADEEDGGDTTPGLLAGGGMTQAKITSDCVMEGNWYSPNLSDTYNNAVGGVSKSWWQSNVDVAANDPEFTRTPSYNSSNEPSVNIKNLRSNRKTTGPEGRNSRPFNQRYGPDQYGLATSRKAGLWGVSSSNVDSPNWLSPIEQKSAILTQRGWEIRSNGNGNPNAMEVIVSGNFANSESINEAPRFYEGSYDLSRTLVGVSGAEINPYLIEVVDSNKILGEDTVTIGSTSGFPGGVYVEPASNITSPITLFRIVGTPEVTGEGIGSITFADSYGLEVNAQITYSIEE